MPIRSPLVDEMEVLEALALEFLVIVAFLAYSEVVVAFLAESVVDEQSNMGAHFVAHNLRKHWGGVRWVE